MLEGFIPSFTWCPLCSRLSIYDHAHAHATVTSALSRWFPCLGGVIPLPVSSCPFPYREETRPCDTFRFVLMFYYGPAGISIISKTEKEFKTVSLTIYLFLFGPYIAHIYIAGICEKTIEYTSYSISSIFSHKENVFDRADLS